MSSPFIITLTTLDKSVLQARARSSTSAHREVIRSRIVLAAAEGATNAGIAAAVGVHVDTVRKWRCRFAYAGLPGLEDSPLSGRRRAFTPVQVAEVKALACTLPAETHRPPNNFDTALIKGIADAYERLDSDVECRAIVLCAEGKYFCAGADFSGPAEDRVSPNELYAQAIRLFRTSKPVVAAVHGAAIAGGLGLALSADFRVAAPASKFAANFSRLGFHPGFGITATLPRIGLRRPGPMVNHLRLSRDLPRLHRGRAAAFMALSPCLLRVQRS